MSKVLDQIGPVVNIFRLVRPYLKSDFIEKVFETFFSQMFNLAVSFISVILFSRILGPTSRGVLATAMAIMALGVQFGNIGLHSSNTYFVAKDRSHLSFVVGNSFVVSLVLGTLISLFIWGGYFVDPSWIPIDGFTLFLTSLLIPCALASLLFQNILIGIQEVRTYNKIEVSVRIFIFVLVCGLFFLDIRSVETILIVNLMSLLLGVYFAWRKIKASLEQKPAFSGEFLKKSLAYGLRTYVATFFSFLVIRIDLLMVKHLLGFEQAGYYSIAANIADIFSIGPMIVGTLLFPKIVAITDEKRRMQVVKKTALGVFIIMSLLGLGCLGCAKMIIHSLLGDAFLPAVPAFLWLLPGLILFAVNGIFMNYLASIGNPWITIFSPGVATLANIVMNLKMIPDLGIVGASISSTICYSSMLMMSLLYLRFRKRPMEIASYTETT